MCHNGMNHDPVQNGNGVQERNFTVESGEVEIPVFEAAPSSNGGGNVLIIHDIFGANDFYHDLARRLANAGFNAYLPDLFIRQGPLREQTHEAARHRGGQLSYPQAIEDVGAILEAVGDDEKWGVVGFCMGGTLVMHLASMEKRLSAGVIYYGFPANPTISANRPSAPMRETSLVDMPLLGFWGDQDAGVGMDNVEQYRSLLKSARKDFEFHIYQDVGHGFLTFDESSESFDASKKSWARSLEFFQEKLS